ncbi:aldo/keto reductase [Cohnella lupini]|uniref:Aryl-alcohol dehydrogenase-like predicted oxidoreductase n=1 Tax=Cohnella lupini TaxID=1294267 RepID=A0A3D9HZ30_9BACL|nr:aldo/keto reductase [Cohnella lupini]RED54733.1 aryl-alcohol dehydrogenase-like predicted oxidoreductase [Cohnella lupini]
MKKQVLGHSDALVSKIGLGCMGMSSIYGNTDRSESIATIHAALEKGITLIDTGDFYGDGHNELLIREAIQGISRDNTFISVKFDGKLHSPNMTQRSGNYRPETVKNFLEDSLQRLGVEFIDLYQPARVDPNVPIEETVGVIADMVKAGYVRHIGLSEVGEDTIRRAHAVHPISWLQIEYSLFNRGIESDILPTLRELGISLSAYGVLSRGLLSGTWSKYRVLASNDKRGTAPRFTSENLERNLVLVEALREIAKEKQVTVAQLAIAWVLSQGDDVFPLVGARKRSQLQDSLGALDLNLNSNDLSRIAEVVPSELVAGEYYVVPREKWFL